MNKKMILVLIALGVVFVAIFLKNQHSNDKITIGVLQTASFPQLDQARETFVLEMKKKYGDKISIVEQNAQGSLTQAQAIASSFKANQNITAFYAIASMAVQALKNEIKDKPIVFAAVTDPNALHLREVGTNITGTSDMANIEKQIAVLSELLPNLKKVSILYNPGEPNSVSLVGRMKTELTKHNIEFEEDGANSQADVAAATEHAVSKAELILIPTDVTMTSAFPVIVQIAKRAHIPIVTTWTGEKSGPLMQFGVDYTKSGVQAANIMEQILNGKKPMDIPVEKPESEVIISSEVLKALNITLPESLKDKVTLM
jgi:putative ABC transport system substrate-binding protein